MHFSTHGLELFMAMHTDNLLEIEPAQSLLHPEMSSSGYGCWVALLDVEQGIILTKLQHDSKIYCHHLLLRLLKLRLHACPSVLKQKIRCPPRIL